MITIRLRHIGQFCCLMFFTMNSFSQNTEQSSNAYIEGAKLTIDLIKTIKDKKVNISQAPKETSSFCVTNKSNLRLYVDIVNTTISDTTNLVVQANGNECSFSINAGNCSYIVKDMNGNIYRKGDIIIEDSDQIQIAVE
jgi:hypothetical protein